MSLLLRIARQAELPEGGKLVKEAHGRKILLTRLRGQVFATDAHCFHMGGNLWEGDIEDVGGHACVVCPLHRYKIDMATGQKVDTRLDGCVVCSPAQQQRTYRVYPDDEFIRIDIPELHTQQALPSDRYNQVAAQQPQQALGGSGLFGAAPPKRGLLDAAGGLPAGRGLGPVAPEPLAPYAGFHSRGLVPDTPSKEAADEPALVLSQEAPQLPAAGQPQQQQGWGAAAAQQQQQPAHFAQTHINFAQSRVDTARIARRKAATAAIAARGYTPPSAPPKPAPQPSAHTARGLNFNANNGAPQQQQQAAGQGQGLARQASGGQQSLLSFGFTRSPAVTTGPGDGDMMDMS